MTEASRYHIVRSAPEERKVLFIHRRHHDSIANILKTPKQAWEWRNCKVTTEFQVIGQFPTVGIKGLAVGERGM